MLPVVILAGGLGSRLGVNPNFQPKILMPVNNKPFLSWKIESLTRQGVSEIYLLLGAGADIVVRYISEQSFEGVKFSIILDGPKLLGTGGSLRNAMPFLPKSFILTYGDNLLDESISNFLEVFQENKKNLMVVTTNAGSQDTKNVKIEHGQIVSYSKERTLSATHLDYGYSILNAEILRLFPEFTTFDLGKIWNKLIELNQLNYYETQLGYREIGTKISLEDTSKWLREHFD